MKDESEIKAKRGRNGGSIPKSPSTGEVVANAVYSLADFKARVRWSNHALRTAKRMGLKVHIQGGTGFVIGRDFIEFLDKISGEVSCERAGCESAESVHATEPRALSKNALGERDCKDR